MARVSAGQVYSANLTTNASDPNGDLITFLKMAGPSWLTVAGDGSVSGTPLSTNVGINTFLL